MVAKDTLQAIADVFSDHVKPAAVIHENADKGEYLMEMFWHDFKVVTDVSPVVAEAALTSKISADGKFQEIIDDLILKFAREIVQKSERMAKKSTKESLRQSKVLRLLRAHASTEGAGDGL